MSGIMLNIAGGSFGEPFPTIIGQAYGGGYYAGQIGVSGVATHYLVVGPVASAQDTLKWQTSYGVTAGTSSTIDGPTNSANMNDASHPAAQFCEGLSIGGHTDWYMPAKNELEIIYFNLKPYTGSNNGSSGINPNAVPARAANYTAGNPAQTSATIFRAYGGAEYFSTNNYWSSTEASSNNAWAQRFDIGYQNTSAGDKQYSLRVRAVRRVAA